MTHTIEKEISGTTLVKDKKGNITGVNLDYTLTGESEHNGKTFPINAGISVFIPLTKEELAAADSDANSQIEKLYIND